MGGGEEIIKLFCRIGFPKEIKFPLFNLHNFQETEKSTSKSCKIF